MELQASRIRSRVEEYLMAPTNQDVLVGAIVLAVAAAAYIGSLFVYVDPKISKRIRYDRRMFLGRLQNDSTDDVEENRVKD